MATYRITIDIEDPSENKYNTWHEIYQQEIDNLPVQFLVSSINNPNNEWNKYGQDK